jgi:hypothetical protein
VQQELRVDRPGLFLDLLEPNDGLRRPAAFRHLLAHQPAQVLALSLRDVHPPEVEELVGVDLLGRQPSGAA